MKKWLILFLALVVPVHAAEILILKNGKMLKLESYEIKGDYVVFVNDLGKVLQLPKSAIDFEKSNAATEAYRAKLEAEEKAYQQRLAEIKKANEKKQKEMTMGEIAKQVESKREGAAPDSVVLDSSKVQKYGEENPYDAPQSNSTSGYTSTDQSVVSNRQAVLSEVPAAYQKAKGNLDALKAKAQSLRDQIRSFENEMAFNDTPGGGEAMFNLVEQKRKDLKRTEEEIKKAETELNQIDRRAKQAGINNYKNVKVKPQTDKEQ